MKLMHGVAAAIGCAAMTASTAVLAETYRRQPGIDVQHYVFDVEVADGTHKIVGETTVTVSFRASGIDRLEFDLKARDKSGLGMAVSSVIDARTGRAVDFTHRGERLLLKLERGSVMGESRDFRIKYAGEPEDGLTFGTSRYGGRAFVTQNWPTKMRDWVPTIDHPSSKSTSEWIVTAPEQYSVVANGLLESESALDGGRKRTHWKQGVAIPSWLNAFQATRFQVWHGGTARGVPLQIWAPAGAKVDVANGFLVARRAIDFFSDVAGPYPYEKLGQVVAPLLAGGGMEHASVIFYGDGGQPDGAAEPSGRSKSDMALTSAPVMAHEIAHQWFGNSVTEDRWGDVWLSESLATYFADLYTEHYEGRDAFTASLRNERTQAFAAERRDKDPVISPEDESAGPDLTMIQYVKGGWVLHMLREQIGSPAFFQGIKLYYRRHQGGHATTADLRQAMEDASGQNLEWFFSQWLKRVDSPTLAITWSYDPAAAAITLTATQQQAGDAYRLAIELATHEMPGVTPTVLKLEMDRKTQTFTFPLAQRPTDLVADPQTRLLADVALLKKDI